MSQQTVRPVEDGVRIDPDQRQLKKPEPDGCKIGFDGNADSAVYRPAPEQFQIVFQNELHLDIALTQDICHGIEQSSHITVPAELP